MKYRWLLISAGAIFLWFAVLQTPFIPHTVRYCEKDQSGKEQCTAYNVTLFVLLKVGKFLDDHNGVIVALATVVLAVFTWRLWVSTEKLWHEATAERQGNETQRVADAEERRLEKVHAGESLSEARKASAAAVDSAAAANASAQSQTIAQRAYIIGDTPDVMMDPKGGQASVRIAWRNSGATPATHVIAETRILSQAEETADHFVFSWENLDPKKLPAWTDIGPGSKVYSSPNYIENDVVGAAILGKHFLCFYAWIEYYDIFHEERHRSEVCMVLHGNGDGILRTNGGPYPYSFRVYGLHNGTDSTCQYEPFTRPDRRSPQLPRPKIFDT